MDRHHHLTRPSVASADGSARRADRRVTGFPGLAGLHRHPRLVTWLFVLVMLGVAGGVALWLRHEGRLDAAPFPMPWWLLIALFFVAEWLSVHLHTRRGAHTLTFIEIPVLIGLATMGPAGFFAARFIGSGAAQVLKGQRGLKLAFNRANSLFGSAIALAVVHSLASDAESIASPRAWLVILLAVLVEAIVLGFTVTAVIAVNDPQRDAASIFRGLITAWGTSLLTSMIGIAALLVASVSLWSIGVIVALAVFAHGAIRMFGRSVRSNQELTALYAFAEAFGEARSFEDVARGGLYELTRWLRADRAAVLVRDGDVGWVEAWCSHDRTTGSSPVDPVSGIELLELIGRQATTVGPSDGPLATWAASFGSLPAIVAPLLVGDEVVGALAVAGRPSPAPTFDTDDIHLLQAAGRQAGASVARAMAEDRLRAEIADKQRLIRSKDQLIAAVSHELRTPLTAILGYAALLEESPGSFDPNHLADIANVIATESNDLGDIVEDLLTAARMDLGVLSVHLSDMELAEMATGVVSRSSDGGVALHVEETNAHADPLRVRQIVRNLLSNAARYGGPNVSVSVGTDPNGAPFVEVSDDGEGIGEADALRIFQPYTSAHDPGTQPGSVGIGLTLSRRLARMMGGELSHRREGDRTIFRLRLPEERQGHRVRRPVAEAAQAS